MELKDNLVEGDITVLQAMEQLDQAGCKVLFIHKEGKLIASLTDGDIRRWILRQGKLSEKINNIANYSPKFVRAGQTANVHAYMREYALEAVPVLDEQNRILSVIHWTNEEIFHRRKKVHIPVVMMAGGLGTRLYPYTKVLPKPLIPIGDIPIAERIINEFRKYGCSNFYLVVNHKKNMIKAYFNEIEKDYQIEYIEENQPLGTGGGLSLLKGKIKSSFILTNCDILVREDIEKIYNYHVKEKQDITMICSLKKFLIPYGVVEVGKDGTISEMQEKPELSFFVNTGCYIVKEQIIEDLDYNIPIDFPDVIKKYKANGGKVGIYPIGESAWLDMGELDGLEKMNSKLDHL